MPNLKPANALPSLGSVTTVEVVEANICLDANPTGQAETERYVRGSLNKGPPLVASPKPFTPLLTRIPVPADVTDEGNPLRDVVVRINRVVTLRT